MEKKQSVQSVQKARTIASFVKKNQLFVQFSNKPLAEFLCQELSKCNSNSYTYRRNDVEIQFYLDSQNGDGRNGGYLCCRINKLLKWDENTFFISSIKTVFNSFECGVEYNDKDIYLLSDVVIDYWGKEVNRIVLFQWDKIIECMERCF